jgi:hypothetical protein
LIERSSRPWDERMPDRDRRSAYDPRTSEHQAASTRSSQASFSPLTVLTLEPMPRSEICL